MAFTYPNEKLLEQINNRSQVKASTSSVVSAMTCGEAYNTGPTAGKQVCVIMNQEKNRSGSDYDVKCLQALFEGHFGATVIVLNNSSKAEFFITLNRLRTDPSICGITLILMAHGYGDVLYLNDGSTLNITNDVIEPLGMSRTLANKPKIIFVEACEGHEIDRGVPVPPVQSDNTGGPPTFVPTSQDIYYLRSTHRPVRAVRDSRYGTLFIQALCETLKQHAYTKNIHKIATIVRSLMSEMLVDSSYQIASSRYDTLMHEYYYYCPENVTV